MAASTVAFRNCKAVRDRRAGSPAESITADETIAFLGLATSIRGLVVSIRDTNSVNPWSAPVNGSNIRSSIARLSGTKTPLSDRMAPKLE